ncbi:MAG: sigma 54-interacting transcriptional regulator [Clostridiales Family XIII bacterium]|jgi:transcriptional regulator of acetoin/glycerol metabolism|nr:sigma 54-interacting transcriptional regulator [Clostridiales Family XIII bacterium]
MSYNPFYNIENPELIGYEYAWVDFIKNKTSNESVIDPQIMDSWKRCQETGLDAAAREIVPKLCKKDLFTEKLSFNKNFLGIADNILDSVIDGFHESPICIYIVDADRIVLTETGNDTDEFFGSLRADFSESYAGTNCIDLALKHEQASSVVGAQHYFQQNHRYAGYASPIRDVDGRLRGAIAIFVMLERMGEYIISIADASAKAIETGIALFRSNDTIHAQNTEKQDILDAITDGIIYLDKDLNITYTNQQFLEFTGLGDESELIGKSIHAIRMKPDISTLLRTSSLYTNIQVKLTGEDQSRKYLLSCRPIANKNDSNNELLIFTPIGEIEKMAAVLNEESKFTFDRIIGRSLTLRKCIEKAMKAADFSARVILEGESGTGKECFAQSIHNRSIRSDEPFIAVDCGALPRELLESELFGYEEGAFTGAQKGGHVGRFEQANNGTLFLDEIGNLPLDMQAKLLRVLQENSVVRIGGHKPIHIDVQIIAATNSDLLSEVEKGRFREDLYYRLNIVHIKVPPLRDRKEDIPLLVRDYIEKNKLKTSIRSIDSAAMEVLCKYGWPGNVRQLYNTLERMMVFAENDKITTNMLPKRVFADPGNLSPDILFAVEIDDLDTINTRYVQAVLDRLDGNITQTAETLGISRSKIYRIIKK